MRELDYLRAEIENKLEDANKQLETWAPGGEKWGYLSGKRDMCQDILRLLKYIQTWSKSPGRESFRQGTEIE